MKRLSVILVLAMLVGILASSTAVYAKEPPKRFKPGDQTIAEIAVGSNNFTTLVAALSCTGLVGAVADPDAELTVFAPDDDAFLINLGLDKDNICDLDNQTLTTILLYHVVGERRPSPSVINGKNKKIEMLAGGYIFPQGKGSLGLVDNNNRVTNIKAADVMASNGIIHVVDNVLLP